MNKQGLRSYPPSPFPQASSFRMRLVWGRHQTPDTVPLFLSLRCRRWVPSWGFVDCGIVINKSILP